MPRLALASLAILVLLFAGCGGDDDTTTVTRTTSQPSTSTAGTNTTVPAPTGKHGPSYFQTPTKNIGCSLSAQSVRCDIRKRDWSPPPEPRYCIKAAVDWGQGIAVGKHRASFVCAGDTTLGGPGLLAYGQTAQRGQIVCLSSRSGIACENGDTGHGFFLSRERYRIY